MPILLQRNYLKQVLIKYNNNIGGHDGEVKTLNVPPHMGTPKLQLFTEQLSTRTSWRLAEQALHD